MNVTVSAAGGKCSLMPLHDRLIIITSALKKYNDNNRIKIVVVVRTTRESIFYHYYIIYLFYYIFFFMIVVVEVSYTHIASLRRVLQLAFVKSIHECCHHFIKY